MQAIEQRPVNAGIAPSNLSQFSEAAMRAFPKAPTEPKRVQREPLRYGPMPGEVFADEAKFGSFS